MVEALRTWQKLTTLDANERFVIGELIKAAEVDMNHFVQMREKLWQQFENYINSAIFKARSVGILREWPVSG